MLCYLNLRDKRYDLVWQALKHQGANVLVISISNVPRACEAARGWGITVIEKPVQLNLLMRNCHAVVAHGGMGLTSMALHADKPVLILPEHTEQAILAYRLSRQGLALGTIRRKDKVLLTKKIDQLLNDEELRHRTFGFSLRYSTYKPDVAVEKVVSMLTSSA